MIKAYSPFAWARNFGWDGNIRDGSERLHLSWEALDEGIELG